MGGKSSQSTQQIQIPPEVLARYNAVNARAEVAAATPFQQYSTDPSSFVAPLTQTQQAGVANTNYYSGAAQPYYAAATQQLGGAQAAAIPFYQQAAQQVGQAQAMSQPLQQSAANAYNQAYAGAQPFQDLATGLSLAGAQGVNPEQLGGQQINRYMSPYLANVLQGTAALQNQMNQQAMSGQTGNAIRQGAFGGDRAGIAAANLAQQQQLASNKIFSDILNQGYGQALSTAQQQQGLGLSAAQANRAALQQAAQQALGIGQQGYAQGLGLGQAQAALGQQQFGQGITSAQQNAALGAGLYGMGSQTAQGLANLGAGAQAAGLQGAQAQLAAGQAQQQTEQAGLQALYNQFLQQQSYPFQVAQFLGNIAMGTGALSGSTTQTNQMLSDKRLKENVKPIGKTFDGQNIYSYNFKGSPQTEIGLLAQEVEKHHPEAVGLAGGYRTVNYDKATDDAADRGHFASGGSAMGGGVMPYHAGEGFYDGGSVGFDPGLMQQILATYQNMYAPMQGQKGGLGAASFVPESTLPVGQLQTAGALPDTPNPMANVKGMVDLGTGLGELGGNLNLWDYTDEQRAETERKKKEKHAFGGLAGARHGYATDGSVDDEIVVTGKRQTPAPTPEPEKIEVPSATPAAAPLAPVAKVDTSKTVEKPAFQKVGLDIPQVANTVGLTPAAALTPLKDSTGDILKGIGSIGMAAATAFSDKRLKENIKPVGKTFDGQTVYSYNYKGEHQTRMGLIAQEVAKHHPNAVGHAGGYKTVDYKKATSAAAHRGHFAFGGDAEETGGAPGLNIPTEGNKIGLAGAPGLTPLQDSTGDIMSGLGSIGQAAAKFATKANGGGLGALEFSNIAPSTDFNLDPEDLVSSGNPLFESLLRQSAEEEEPKSSGLAPAKDTFIEEMQRRKVADEDWHKGMKAPSGLNPEGGNPSLTSNLSMIAKMIRGHEGTGRNPNSSASAPYQMIDDTFVDQFKKQFPDRAANMSRGAILSLRRTPEGTALAEAMGPQLIKENARFLEMRGFVPNARNVYLAHFFGPETAVRVLSSNPNAPIEQVVGQRAVASNPFLRGKDVSGAIQFADQAMARQQKMLSLPERADGGRIHKEVGGPLNLLPAEYRDVSPDEAADIGGRGAETGSVSAEDMVRMLRTAQRSSDPVQATSALYKTMEDKGIGVTGSKPQASGVAGGEPVAPAAAPAPAGLAAATKPAKEKTPSRPIDEEIGNIPGYNTDYYRTPFLKGLKKGSAQSWIPLLTGIGASLSGPYRGLVGLGQGLSAGAQSYANIAAKRNEQLPVRQAAMAQMANVGRQLLPSVLRLAPDGVNYIYMSQDGPVTVSPQDATRLRQEIIFGGQGRLPVAPAGAQPYTYEAPKPKDYRYTGMAEPGKTSVEGINALANQDPTVAQAFSARQQAADAMAEAKRLIDSPYASQDDIERGNAKLTAATKQYEAADQRYTSSRNAIMQPLLQSLGTSVEQVGSYNIGVLGERERERSMYKPIEPVLDAIEQAGFAGGVSSNFWNNVTSLAKRLGAPDAVIGDGQSDAQKRAALAKLLEGTGVSPDAFSIGQDPVATKAAVEAIRARIKNAQYRYDEAIKAVGTPTAAPRAIPSAGNAPPAAPAPKPRASATPSGNVRSMGPNTWGGRSYADLQSDPRVKNGDTIWYKDEKGVTRSGTMSGK